MELLFLWSIKFVLDALLTIMFVIGLISVVPVTKKFGAQFVSRINNGSFINVKTFSIYFGVWYLYTSLVTFFCYSVYWLLGSFIMLIGNILHG